MIYAPVTSNKFVKDLKRAKKRGKDLSKIKNIMTALLANTPLPFKNKDHALIGNFDNRRECHIEPDWLLIYKVDEAKLEIVFERTGSHSDLF